MLRPASVVLPVLGSAILVEGPVNMIVGQTAREDAARVVEHKRIGLARRRTQDASDHLPEETEALGRSCDDLAARDRAIPALGQDHAIRHDLKLARREFGERTGPLLYRRRAVDVSTGDTGLGEFALDMLAVGYVNGEDDRWPVLAEAEPMLDDVADELSGIYALGQLRFIIPALDANSG